MTAADLWARLSASDVVSGERPEPVPSGSPWFVRLMLGIAGWIGALFLLGFVGTALEFILEDGPSAIIAGAVCCAAAFAIFQRMDGKDAAEQFALALSLAGQGLLIVGLADIFDADDPTLYFAIAAVELALVWMIPNFVHRFLAAAGSALAITLAINQLGLHGLATPLLCVALALIWLDATKWATAGSLWRPIGYGLVLAVITIETFHVLRGEDVFGIARADGWMALHGQWIGRGVTGVVLLLASASLAVREGYRPGSRIFLLSVCAAGLSAILGVVAPGLGSTLLILLLGYAAGNRLLVGAGIFGLLGFTSHYYYSLHASLLSKSAILALTGFVLLAIAWYLRRDGVRHA